MLGCLVHCVVNMMQLIYFFLAVFLLAFQQSHVDFFLTFVDLPSYDLIECGVVFVGVAARKETAIRIAWTPPRLPRWGSLLSKHWKKCLMTASRVSRRRDSCKTNNPCYK